MRILFLSYEIPRLLDAGDRIYSAGLLSTLISKGHDVHLVGFARGEKPHKTAVLHCTNNLKVCLDQFTAILFSPKNRVRAFFSFRPGMIANRYSWDYVRTVLRIIKHDGPYDVILVNHFKMAYLVSLIRPAVKKTPMILITHNVESLFSKSIYQRSRNPVIKVAYFLDSIKMRIYEPLYMRQFNVVTAITESDCKFLRKKYNLHKVEIVSPGIDLSEYQVEWPNIKKEKGVIICGSFNWKPHRFNLIHFLKCPTFRKFIDKGITVRIVGKADLTFVKQINDSYPNVEMTGYVPDVRPYYDGCSIALIPELIGGGFKMKLLEAVAMKKIVIALKGAISAQGFLPGYHFIEALNLNDVVDLTMRLFLKPEKITHT